MIKDSAPNVQIGLLKVFVQCVTGLNFPGLSFVKALHA